MDHETIKEKFSETSFIARKNIIMKYLHFSFLKKGMGRKKEKIMTVKLVTLTCLGIRFFSFLKKENGEKKRKDNDGKISYSNLFRNSFFREKLAKVSERSELTCASNNNNTIAKTSFKKI